MYHTIIIVGNLGRDPEMRYTPAGQAVTNFNVAVNDDYTNNAGEKVKRTIWIRVSAWGKTAENANQYLKKGNKVLVEGHLVCDPATGGPKVYNKNDGTSGASFEVSAATVRYLSSKNERSSEEYSGGSSQPSATEDDEESIPF